MTFEDPTKVIEELLFYYPHCAYKRPEQRGLSRRATDSIASKYFANCKEPS
jgi:hypothetical protein